MVLAVCKATRCPLYYLSGTYVYETQLLIVHSKIIVVHYNKTYKLLEYMVIFNRDPLKQVAYYIKDY